jgi:hypothetical protein
MILRLANGTRQRGYRTILSATFGVKRSPVGLPHRDHDW